jgi:acyl dehydratase
VASETVAREKPVRPRSVADLRTLVGTELGPSAWHAVTQKRIDAFAAATEDFQWIHIDRRRAAETLGTTISHGLFTLSLGPKFTMEIISFDGFERAINYGFDRVRFPAPVPSESRVRMRLSIDEVTEVEGGAQVSMTEIFECKGVGKPVCVATSLARFYET